MDMIEFAVIFEVLLLPLLTCANMQSIRGVSRVLRNLIDAHLATKVLYYLVTASTLYFTCPHYASPSLMALSLMTLAML